VPLAVGHPLFASGNPVGGRSILKALSCFLWYLDPDGWPTERIDTLTGQHVPFFAGRREDWLCPQGGRRPIAC
jgi:hypothetical protein